MTSKPTGASAGGSKTKFELPALDFKFGSLTDGTDIPAPLPSPVQEVPTPPKTPTAETKASNKAAKPADGVAKAANGSSQAQKKKTNGTIAAAGTKRPADDVPLSPPPSSRQGSIRKLLSRTFLNNSYEEGEAQANGTGPGPASNNNGRPASRSNASTLDDKKAKRSSGWFRRLRPGSASDSASKRASTIYQEPPKPQSSKPAGPPPPMIPEFNTLGPKLDLSGDQGSLGGSDMFKNIK